MQLFPPLIITPRLMPGLAVGGGFISLGNGPRNAEGRTVYSCFIDLPDGTEHEVKDLRSGCQGGGIQEGLESLLAFLGAAAESYGHKLRTGQPGDNEDLFPPAVVEWAHQNSDELGMLQCELEENKNPVQD